MLMQLKKYVPIVVCSLALCLFTMAVVGLFTKIFAFCVICILFGCLLIRFWPNTSFSLSRFFPQEYTQLEVVLSVLLIVLVLVNFLAVFTPETAFDALWYHLPTIQEYVAQQKLVYDVRWYQTLYPQYGDLFFAAGYSVGQLTGAKTIAFVFFLFLLNAVFHFLRESLSKSLALLGVLSVASFQVVSWQASSVYVDLISAVFFVWLHLSLLAYKKTNARLDLVQASLCLGVFLGIKFIHLGYLPLLFFSSSVLFFRSSLFKTAIQKLSIFWMIGFLVSFPWYLRSYVYTGNLLYPMGSAYADPVIKQMGVSGWSEWLVSRFLTVWKLPIDFFLHSDGYTTYMPIFVLLLFVFYRRVGTIENVFARSSLLFGVLFWYFFPPPSTRYVMGPLILSFMLLYREVFGSTLRSSTKRLLITTFLCLAVFHISLRLFITTRIFPYLLGMESQQDYLTRFRNGFLDEKIDAFYGRN